jgi:hypothetical protein
LADRVDRQAGHLIRPSLGELGIPTGKPRTRCPASI